MNSSSALSTTPRHIAVVAPSGAPPDEAAVKLGLTRLQEQGFTVHSFYDPEQKYQRFGGRDAHRVAQIHAAASDPEVEIVLALRGSYGLSRLLPDIDFDLLAQSGKLFVGYSDFTLVHQGLLQRGCRSLAGPMLCDDYTREQQSVYTIDQFMHCISADSHRVEFETAYSGELQVSGKLWGGNLAMLTHTAGTPYWHHEPEGILFLEDIGEHPYRIERMLLQLHYAGVLANQKAIVLGHFSAYKLAPHDNGYDMEAMLDYLRSIIAVPVVTGLPFGHTPMRASLMVGSQAELRVTQQQATLAMQW